MVKTKVSSVRPVGSAPNSGAPYRWVEIDAFVHAGDELTSIAEAGVELQAWLNIFLAAAKGHVYRYRAFYITQTFGRVLVRTSITLTDVLDYEWLESIGVSTKAPSKVEKKPC